MSNYNAITRRVKLLETRMDDEVKIELDRMLIDQALLTDVSGNYIGYLSPSAAAECPSVLLGLLGFKKEPGGFFIHGKRL